MEFRDLKTQYQVLKAEIDAAVAEVLTECNFISGQQVSHLEERLATYVEVEHCISCANGTDALLMVLMAWGIGPGDAVFVPSFTFFATAEVVTFLGATPIFVDVDPDTYNIDVESLSAAIEAVLTEGVLQPTVVIPVDLFGQTSDYLKIEQIAQRYNLKILVDAAQSFGAKHFSQRSGSFGDAATTSFFPAKPLGCYGDGGAIFTRDANLAEHIRSLAVHGKGASKYDNVKVGMNSRLDTIQAAILGVKLQAFIDYELDAMQNVTTWYTNALGNKVKTPLIPEGYYSSWAQYTIQLETEKDRDTTQARLAKHGIPSLIYYVKGLHQQEAFKDVKQYVSCSVTESLTKKVLSLPLDPYKKKDEIEKVAAIITDG